MKVLHVISAPAAGGAEVYVKDLVGQFVSSGIEVFIAFLSHAEDIGRDAHYEACFLSDLDEMGVKYFFIGRKARKNLVVGMMRVLSFVKKNNIDIYHSHLKYGVVFGAFLRIPVVYTHHNIVVGAGCWWRPISNYIVDSYIGISKVCSAKLAADMGRRVSTVTNGVDRKRMEPAGSLREFPQGVINIIAVGSISPQKNYRLMVDAVAALPKEIKNKCTVQIVGEGPSADVLELEKYIKSHKLGDIFSLLGNRGDVPALLAKADLFLMSSEYEGLPISLIEATMSGLPSVVTDVGGCSEVVELCGNGITTTPGDARDLASAIETVFSDSKQYSQLSRNALANSDCFSIQTAAKKHISIYQDLLTGR